MNDVKFYLDAAEKKMQEAVDFLDDTLAHIRAGKANVKILDGIRVNYYGSPVPILRRPSSTATWASCP